MKRKSTFQCIAALVLLAVMLSVSGCSNWERSTFQTLSSAKAVIDQASNDYNAGTIAKTQENRDLLAKAQQTKDAAVLAFRTYWDEKSAIDQKLASGELDKNAAGAKLEVAIASVNTALKDLPPLIAALQKLGH